MYRLVFLISLLSMMMLTGCIPSSSGDATIGVVDTARVFRDSDAGKKGFKYLEKIQTEMQMELNKIQEQLKKNPENKEVAQQLQETYVQFQQRIEAEQQNVITLLNEASQRVLDAYRISNKLLIIVSSESTLSYDNKVDVTSGIITELNKEKVEFKFDTASAPITNMNEVKKAVVEEKAPAKKVDAKAKAKE